MPQKKPKKARAGERHPVTLRFNDNEMAALNTDRRQLGGIPVSVGAYAKHAVISYAHLRVLEQQVRYYLDNHHDEFPGGSKLARELLEVSGLAVRP